MPEDVLSLDRQLCFSLYQASRAVTRAYRPLLEKLGLTYPQYLVMLVLWEAGEPRGVKEIGAKLGLESGTLTPLLRRLEQNGLVVRNRGDDERRRMIALTDVGAALRGRAAEVPAAMEAVYAREGATAGDVDVNDVKHFLDDLAAHMP